MRKRLGVLKTYKIYIGGKFPRTESGRFYELTGNNGDPIANICRSSRKDFRNSVVAARKAFAGWADRTAYNRAQILYRIAEMLEGRREQFISELRLQGDSVRKAESEVNGSIDRLIYFAGWADKYVQVFSSVNPVSSSHFNFSVPEPTGVVTVMAPEESGLLGLISAMAPVIAGGNTCVILASHSKPLCSISLAEVLHSSDLPGGVVNILTGIRSELIDNFSTHMDVNAVIYCGDEPSEIKKVQENASINVKRAHIIKSGRLNGVNTQDPYQIMATQEIKTTWHPVGN
ncbi:MAG: aldehyde dehydrogenase family protein [Candidatus Marinimicrobia bacterium]|nr:aldehyde dehydrogenase family protein [Candidatus Neomarinimicrobiota bacterium]